MALREDLIAAVDAALAGRWDDAHALAQKHESDAPHKTADATQWTHWTQLMQWAHCGRRFLSHASNPLSSARISMHTHLPADKVAPSAAQSLSVAGAMYNGIW